MLAKNKALSEYKAILRKFIVNELLFSDYLTDVDRKSIELNIHDKKPTPSPVSSSAPVGRVDFSERHLHKIYATDEHTSGKAKPAGVHGFEIWQKIGEEAKDTKGTEYVDTAPRSPHKIQYSEAEQGKTIYYYLR
ncbi:hypothetical protein Barb4_00845 [Bacteroidales bacterium Barb4]|nr:hypothetical protein Barb4_00845 [Bacteroidales bacterium Barb4]